MVDSIPKDSPENYLQCESLQTQNYRLAPSAELIRMMKERDMRHKSFSGAPGLQLADRQHSMMMAPAVSPFGGA